MQAERFRVSIKVYGEGGRKTYHQEVFLPHGITWVELEVAAFCDYLRTIKPDGFKVEASEGLP